MLVDTLFAPMTYSAIEFEDRDVKEELVGFKSIEWKS
jgi:hypothetical protein